MRQTYLPARLVKTKNHRGNDRWYIKFYQVDPSDGIRKRHRVTCELNRVEDEKQRQKMAEKTIAEINKKLPYGYPYVLNPKKKKKNKKIKPINILDGLDKALHIKSKSDSHNTTLNKKSILSIFTEFLNLAGLQNISIHEFSIHEVMSYVDYLKLDRGVGNVSVNNSISTMKSLFNVLAERGYLKKNPFSKIKKAKTKGKLRRAFTESERRIIINHLDQESKAGTVKARKIKMLVLAIKLQYHCLIRPTELLKLRFLDFDLSIGVIRMSAEINKNNSNEMVTIPDFIVNYLKDFGIDSHPNQNDLIFGRNGQPHATIPGGHGMLGTWMRKELQYLHKVKKLHSIEGLSLYSWKDTGIMELFKSGVNMLEIMKQARHKDLKTTQMYCQSLYYINRQIKALFNPLNPNDQPE